MLRTEHKDAFRDALVRAIEGSDARAFSTTPTTLAWVPNLERSRYFLVLKLTRPRHDDLNKLLAACNTCASSWGLDALYEQPASDSGAKASSQTHDPYKDTSSAFHISVAWTLEKPSEAQQRMIVGEACEQLRGIGIDLDCVKVKIGNVVTGVSLPAT